MFGVDELVGGAGAQVVDVVDQEGVGGWVLGQEDDLGAAGREREGDGRADAGCSALTVRGKSVWLETNRTAEGYEGKRTVIITTLPCISRSDVFLAPEK